MGRVVVAEEIRRLFGNRPTAVPIVGAPAGEGESPGYGHDSLSVVSTEPTLLLVRLSRSSQELAALAAAGTFTVRLFAEDGEEAGRTVTGASPHRFAVLERSPLPRPDGGPLPTAVGYAECRTTEWIEAGDHWVFVGRVEHVNAGRTIAAAA